MRDRYTFEIATLKEKLLALALAVESALAHAMDSVKKGDVKQAEELIARDSEIDAMEVTIEEECLKLMALYQPVAGDLRLLVTILKVNGELERVADFAATIAARIIDMVKYEVPSEVAFDFAEMEHHAQQMLFRAINAFVSHRADAARKLILEDEVIDKMNATNYALASERLHRFPEFAGYILDCLTISQAIERIGDIATNICEDVVYLEEGAIVRHRKGSLEA